MENNFCEEFDKSEFRKGFVLVAVLVILSSLPVSGTNNIFLIYNYNALAYLVMFILLIILYYRQIFGAIKQFHMNGQEIGFLTGLWFGAVALQVVIAILLDSLDIVNYNRVGLEEDATKGVYVLSMLATVLCGPMVEEFIYRFWIYRMVRKINVLLAGFVCVCLFALSHVWSSVWIYHDFRLILNALIYVPIGIATVIAYEKNKNILCALLLHVALNAFAFFH